MTWLGSSARSRRAPPTCMAIGLIVSCRRCSTASLS